MPDSFVLDPALMQESFPGLHGMPYRGIPFHRRNNDPQHMQPVLRVNVFTRIFEFGPEDSSQLDDYSRLCSKIAELPMAQGRIDERKWIPEEKKWVVLLQWLEYYYDTPTNVRNDL